jgi:hypothetical protein
MQTFMSSTTADIFFGSPGKVARAPQPRRRPARQIDGLDTYIMYETTVSRIHLRIHQKN